MKKIISLLLGILITSSVIAQQMTKEQVAEAAFRANEKLIKNFSRLQDKGKLEARFYFLHKKGIEEGTVKMFFGDYDNPFPNGYSKGTQGFYDVKIYNGYKNLRMKQPMSFGGSTYYFLKSFWLSDKNQTIKVLGWSKPITFFSANQEQADFLKKEYEKIGIDLRKDIYQKVFIGAFLPMEEFKKQQEALHQAALKESKEWSIKNIDDATYYAWYYGKGNRGGYKYNEDIVKKGFPNIDVKHLPTFIKMFHYNPIVNEAKIKYINYLNDFETLLSFYNEYDTGTNKEIVETKLFNLVEGLSEIDLFTRSFPNSKYLSDLDVKAYDIVSGKNKIPLYKKYLSIFPTGKHQGLVQSKIDKIRNDEKERRERIIKEREEKITKEGKDAIYFEYSERLYGIIWGFYEEYYVEYNDYTTGTYYYVDNYYCLGFGLFSTQKICYNTKEDAVKALYIYQKTEEISDIGRFYPSLSTEEPLDNEEEKQEITQKDYTGCLEDIDLVAESFTNPILFGKNCKNCVVYYKENWIGKSDYCILQDEKGDWWVENGLDWSGPYDTKEKAIKVQWCGEQP